MIVIIE